MRPSPSVASRIAQPMRRSPFVAERIGHRSGPDVSSRGMNRTRVTDAGGKGRGVFAAEAIRAGELIERAPVIAVPGAQWPLLERTVLFDYCFAWGPELQDCCVALGHGSFYNHSYAPNARFVRRLDLPAMDFVARRDIAAGEELTINYNEDQDSQAPVWFDLR
jgi:uncharacterized protein